MTENPRGASQRRLVGVNSANTSHDSAIQLVEHWYRNMKVQGGPEKLLLETIDPFVLNSNLCEPPCSIRGIRVKIVGTISRGENDIQAVKNKQSACEIVIQPVECRAKLSAWSVRLLYPFGLSASLLVPRL